jgi:hypothetical protein
MTASLVGFLLSLLTAQRQQLLDGRVGRLRVSGNDRLGFVQRLLLRLHEEAALIGGHYYFIASFHILSFSPAGRKCDPPLIVYLTGD